MRYIHFCYQAIQVISSKSDRSSTRGDVPLEKIWEVDDDKVIKASKVIKKSSSNVSLPAADDSQSNSTPEDTAVKHRKRLSSVSSAPQRPHISVKKRKVSILWFDIPGSIPDSQWFAEVSDKAAATFCNEVRADSVLT